MPVSTRRSLRRALSAALVAAIVALPQVAFADEVRDRQYWLQEYGISQAWQFTKGAGVTIAVIDTGVDSTHIDLQGVVIDRLAQGHSYSTERDTLFIDRGFADGVLVGDTFYIVSQRDPYLDDSKENYELPPVVIGRVVIVDVKEDSSVAVLTDVHTTIGMDGEKAPVSVTQSPF